jgi:uncharacterized protein (DUF2235 family)
MRNLIVCADGTWSTAEQETDGIPRPTNVARLFSALADTGAGGEPQLRYYHPGIGTKGSWLRRLAGGAIGVGLGRNVMSAYRWLSDTYQPDDRLLLFGFSRGAYTVRSLAGLITRCGLIVTQGLSDHDAWTAVGRVYEHGYRQRQDPAAWSEALAFHHRSNGQVANEIHFLGVWDTVGALGIPDNFGVLNLFDDASRYRFHDTELNEHVLNARHAVALDERRASFSPTLWNNDVEDRRIQQQWFPGTHGDIGGGHIETGLSDGALKWMLEEAAAFGLGVEPDMTAQIKPNPQGLLHDSLNGIWRRLFHQPRMVPALTAVAAGRDQLHPSALARQQRPPIDQAPYRRTRLLAVGESEILDIFAIERWNDTGLYLEADARYRFAADGEWLDAAIPCGPAGDCRPRLIWGSLAHQFGTWIGRAEQRFASMTGNPRASFVGSRRVETAPWFALVGVIANGMLQTQQDGSPVPHETLVIGAGLDAWTPKQGSGYLYCFANDAWRFYGNNRGHVRLTVTRTG